MFIRLAVRNVKRQIGSYLIYFITVTMTVAMMFAINNIIYSKELLEYARSIAEMRMGLTVLSVFIGLIIAFVLGYATSFMLKLRKREFGTYLTMGMNRKNILCIFLLETLIMSGVALVIGMFLGLFIYQGMMAVMTKLMDMEFHFASYSPEGFVLTVILVAGVFILASVTSAVYLNRVSIYELIHSEKKMEKQVKHPALWLVAAVVSFLIIIGSFVAFYKGLNARGSDSGEEISSGLIMGSLFTFAVSILTFHISLARSAVGMLLKNVMFCNRGTNTFTLRQLSGKLSSNSVILGILAFLIAFSVVGANVAFTQKAITEEIVEMYAPFDVSYSYAADETPQISVEEAKGIIEKYSHIEKMVDYSLYTNHESIIYGYTKYSGEGYEGLTDSFIKESDFNRIMELGGYETVDLEDNFYIIENSGYLLEYDFSGAELRSNGKTYSYGGKLEDVPSIAYMYILVLVPDEFVEGMEQEVFGGVMKLKDNDYDAAGLEAELTYTYDAGEYLYERCDYTIKEHYRMEQNSSTAIFAVGALYIATVFVFMAMAILALKTLAGMADDKRKYNILYKLGADEKEQRKTLFRQIFSFFILPFALPVMLSLPVGFMCKEIISMIYEPEKGEIYMISASIGLVVFAIYMLYFLATYLVAKKSIIEKA